MKVLHLVAGELSGGAAKGALNLHNALLDLGVKSHILTTAKDIQNHPNISNLNKYQAFFYAKIDGGISRICGSKNIFSNNFFGFNILKHNVFQKADIIHLHWINSGFISLSTIAKIKKPIVWSVRDMWAFSGGCHYAIANNALCFKYQTSCKNCPALSPKIKILRNLAHFNQRAKIRHYPQNLHFVGISSFISECLQKSAITKNANISTIANCIDESEFMPIDKNIARQILRLNTHKKIILCGANALGDFYKGFSHFLEALKFLPKDKYFLCFFGKLDRQKIPQGFEFRSFGYHNSNLALRLIYSVADVFVAPSLLDAAPKTIMESLSCNTSAVAFDNSGARDIISHKINGYLAKFDSAKDLARGIDFVANNALNARKGILNFSAKNIAKQYLALYEKMLNGGGGRIS
ncbi:glycosyltransferase [Helicobacter sp. 23-1044]